MSEINEELIEPIKLDNEYFTIDEGEKALLNGTYSIRRYVNPHPNLEKLMDEYWNKDQLFHAKRIYMLGNILYKLNEPQIEDMIDLIIRCTHADKLPDYVDKSVHKKKQMRSGTICPSKEVIFRFDGKLFILYGRYIYGYDKPYVSFLNNEVDENADDDDDEYEDISDHEEWIREALLTREEIVVPTVASSYKDIPTDEYNYAFSIIEEKTGVLCAFAIYR